MENDDWQARPGANPPAADALGTTFGGVDATGRPNGVAFPLSHSVM